jgi:hypothetical protein
VTPLVFANENNTATYKNFDECFDGVIEPKLATADSAALEKLKTFHDGGGLDALKFLEEKYHCASMCTAPLFYTTLSIAEELPTQECLHPTLNDAKE